MITSRRVSIFEIATGVTAFVFSIVILGTSSSATMTPQDVATQDAEEIVEELGTVKWTRDIAAAKKLAKKKSKPILVLFQEIPG